MLAEYQTAGRAAGVGGRGWRPSGRGDLFVVELDFQGRARGPERARVW